MVVKKNSQAIDTVFVSDIKQLLRQAKDGVLRQVNTIMVQTYFLIGKRIVEQEQEGKTTAQYGAYVLEVLSVNLTK